MINEANASSSACRLWRIPQVETGAPPSNWVRIQSFNSMRGSSEVKRYAFNKLKDQLPVVSVEVMRRIFNSS
jgi:hypothetical protein